MKKQMLSLAVIAASLLFGGCISGEPGTKKDTLDPYDISGLVSGVPQAVKPSKPFILSEHTSSLRSRFSFNRPEDWENIFDTEVLKVVSLGYVHSVRYLLERGVDINKKFYNPSSSGFQPFQKKKILLLEYLFYNRASNIHDFTKMLLFLVENGLDLNVKFSDGRYFLSHFIEHHEKSIFFWKLIPYFQSYGAKLDPIIIADGKITNEMFREYLQKIQNRTYKRPALKKENRFNKYKNIVGKMKTEVPAPTIFVISPRNPLFIRFRFNNGVYVSHIAEILSKGYDINVINLEDRIGGHIPVSNNDFNRIRYLSKNFMRSMVSPWIIPAINNKDVLAFLVDNGWRWGIDSCKTSDFKKESNWYLWEFGIDITYEDINKATDYKTWKLLNEAYSKQMCQFGNFLIKKRSESYWSQFDAFKAVKNNDISAMEKILEKNIDVNFYYNDRSEVSHLLGIAAQNEDSKKMISLLLKNNADPNILCRRGLVEGVPLEFALNSCRLENAEILIEKTTVKIPPKRLIRILRHLVFNKYSRQKNNVLESVKFILTKLASAKEIENASSQTNNYRNDRFDIDEILKTEGCKDQFIQAVLNLMVETGFKPTRQTVESLLKLARENKTNKNITKRVKIGERFYSINTRNLDVNYLERLLKKFN